jgi:hypothetical protein
MTSFRTVGTRPTLPAGTNRVPKKRLMQPKRHNARPVEIRARLNDPDIGMPRPCRKTLKIP